MEMELVGLPGKGRAQSLRQPSGFHSMKTYYQSVCESQRRASERNTALLADLSNLRQRLQLAKETTSNHLTRFTSLKCHYEAYVVSAHTEWVKLTAQQISVTSRRRDNRQPDSLITSTRTVPERPRPPISGHTPIPPPSAPIASSTLLEPLPLASLEATTRDQSTLHTAKKTLLSQQNDAAPSSLAELGPGVSIQAESKQRTPSHQGETVLMKDGDMRQAVTERQGITIRERSSVMLVDKDSVIQTATVEEGGSKVVSLSTCKEEMGESAILAGDDQSERGMELPRPHSTDPEQLLEELGLSSLSLSPSHSHSVNLSPTNSTHQSLDIQTGNSKNIIEPGVVRESGEQLSMDQDGVLTEELSASHDDLSVESVPTSERAVQLPGVGEAEEREEEEEERYSMPDKSTVKQDSPLYQPPPSTNTSNAESAAVQPPSAQNLQSVSSSQPTKDNVTTSLQDLERVASQGDKESISTTEQDKDSVANSDQDEEAVSSSLSVSSSKQTAPADPLSPPLTASQERDHHQIIPSDDGGDLLDGRLSPTDGTLSESDDRASVEGVEGTPAGMSSVLAGKSVVTVVLNLLSTLNQHLSVDAESADVMHSLPAGSDSMKGQINSSSVLAANLTKMAVVGKDVSTWEPGAVSVVLLQQLSHMTSSMGGLLPQQLLKEDAPLLTSCEELSSHMTQQWSAVWPLLLEHIMLLSGCGRSLTELATTLTPALVAPGNPAHREKACLQLLSILQGKVERSSPKATRVEREPPSLSEASSPEPSLKEESVNAGEEKGGRLEMAMTVFGEEDDLSELLSEGSAITEVERELRETVMAGERQQHGRAAERAATQQQQTSLTNFTSSPLHFHPSPSDDGDVSDSSADSSPPQSSPGYIPTALEQRNSALSSQASHHSSLRRRRIGLGLLSESESEGSGHDDGLHPPTMPLDSQPGNKTMEGHVHMSSHSTREDLELEDFDFYD